MSALGLMKTKLFIDIETDGLDPTRVWCIVVDDGDTVTKFTPDKVDQFPRWLENQDDYFIVGHNILEFDVPVLNRLLGMTIKTEECYDTLVLSRLGDPVRSGGHSLEAWGNTLGYPKIKHEDWSEFSPDMMDRCARDVEITKQVYENLKVELQSFTAESVRLEHDVTAIFNRMRWDGFTLDVERAHKLLCLVKAEAGVIETEVLSYFQPVTKPMATRRPRHNKDGSVSKVGLGMFTTKDMAKCKMTLDDVIGELSPVVMESFNLGSPKQVNERLNKLGWKPTERTQSGEWFTISETNLNTIPDTAPQCVRNLSRMLMLRSRVKLIKGWLDASYHKDNKVHGSIISIGAITHRCAHRNPNMANIPAVSSPYGRECRSCFRPSASDRVIVGADASSIQLRMLAHYMGDKDYINAILTGDIHTYNQEAAGIATRDQAKTFIYAWLLGAGDAKIGQIVGGNAKRGRELKAKFIKNIPALAELKLRAKVAADRGYLVGLDGRRLSIKSEHYALSSYLQGGEAVVMKWAMRHVYEEIRDYQYDARFVAFVHDEWQTDTHKDYADAVGSGMVRAIVTAGKHFNLRCPLNGEYKIGNTWAETH